MTSTTTDEATLKAHRLQVHEYLKGVDKAEPGTNATARAIAQATDLPEDAVLVALRTMERWGGVARDDEGAWGVDRERPVASGPGWTLTVHRVARDEDGNVTGAEFTAIIDGDPDGERRSWGNEPIGSTQTWEWNGPRVEQTYDRDDRRSGARIQSGQLRPYLSGNRTTRQLRATAAAMLAAADHVEQSGWDKVTPKLAALLAIVELDAAILTRDARVDRMARELAAPALEGVKAANERDYERAMRIIDGRVEAAKEAKRVQAVADTIRDIQVTAKHDARAIIGDVPGEFDLDGMRASLYARYGS